MAHRKPETRIDFLQCLETDLSLYIMSFLDDPADLVRASAVSSLWRHFVIVNGLAKQLFSKTFPQRFSIAGVVNASEGAMNLVEVKTNNAMEWEILESDHKVYASLIHAITKSFVHLTDCIANAVSTSSTDNYPDESVVHSLNLTESLNGKVSYWSSTGQRNPEVPETLIYKLRAGIWAITIICMRPFEAVFQQGSPVYSARSVRFRMGHPKSPREIGNDLSLHECADDKFVWTYTSPEFPMKQEGWLQQFVLPEPVLSIGGYVQVELLGRVQRQKIDGLFYIRMCSVGVFGRPLFPAFNMEILEPDGKLCLMYYPEHLSSVTGDYWMRNIIARLHQRLQQRRFAEAIVAPGTKSA